MNKERLSFYGARTWTILALSILISSCHGQENRVEVSNAMLPRQTVAQHAAVAPEQPKEQISQVVRTVFQDSRGDIWFGTENGAFRLTGQSLLHVDSIKGESGRGVTIKDIAEDQDGTIWFVSDQHDLYTYDGTDLQKFQKPADNQGPVVFRIYKDQADRLWFVGYGGAYRLEDGAFIQVTRDGPW